MSSVSVAVPVPFLDLLTYRVPDGMTPPVKGARVLVPVGRRVVVGCVVGEPLSAADRPEPVLKDIVEVVDATPFLPSEIVDLALWMARYYACGPGEAIRAAMPPLAAAVGRRRRPGSGTKGNTTVDSASPDAERGTGVDPGPAGPVVLTAEQAAAVERLSGVIRQGTFGTAVLHGVTGSGKTEVYLRLAAEVCAHGRTALVLVPEIGLTPVLAAQFRAAFGDRVAVQHSGLTERHRHDQWLRIRRGEVDVVVGTRSAVFAPLAALGVVVVDEEHDTSYKQEEAPRYHARDVAIVRAKQAGALAVLGSATPSLESFYNVRRGRYAVVSIGRRVLDRPLASVRLVDMREEFAARGPDALLSRALEAAIDDRLRAGHQVLILLNRRGFATAVFCRQCAGTLECPNCSVSLIVHHVRGQMVGRCHYCNHSRRVPKACPLCAAPYLEQLGFGTARVEQELAGRFPSARIARLDRDVAAKRGAIGAVLERFRTGAIDLLVGTQMIAKGHDFPRVTLVGVISADVGLGLADFRAGERTFQLLTQVVGRAGRGAEAGEAIIQTLYPDHYSIVHACRQDYDAFFQEELRYRRAMRYPPIVAMIAATFRGRSLGEALDTAGRVGHLLRTRGQGAFHVLGPAPAPLVRLRGQHRVHLFLKGPRRGAMRQALQAVLTEIPGARRRAVVIDVDPVSVL